MRTLHLLCHHEIPEESKASFPHLVVELVEPLPDAVLATHRSRLLRTARSRKLFLERAACLDAVIDLPDHVCCLQGLYRHHDVVLRQDRLVLLQEQVNDFHLFLKPRHNWFDLICPFVIIQLLLVLCLLLDHQRSDL